MIRSISDEFIRIEELKFKWGAVAYFSRDHKEDREWSILGATQRLLAYANADTPTTARKTESPDFECFRDTEGIIAWGNVEIVEALPSGYRRHEFHKKDALPNAPRYYPVAPPLISPWEPLRKRITDKAAMSYASTSTLIAYFDIGTFAFEDWDTPFHIRILRENKANPFCASDAFSKALVLNCDMQSLVQLTPLPEVIVPAQSIWE